MAPFNKQKHKPKAQKAPAFDEAALTKLTSKLDKSLSHSDKTAPPKRKRQDGAGDSRNGTSRRQEVAREPARKKAKAGDKQPQPSGKLSREALLEEIKALGGDENDLDLVANIDSDAEEGAAPQPKGSNGGPVDNIFKNELAKFASSLGFQNVAEDDAETDESGEEEENEEEEEEGGNEPEEDLVEELPPPEEPKRDKKKKGKLMFEPRSDWYATDTNDLPAPISDDIKQYSSAIAHFKTYAKSLLDEDAAAHGTSQTSSSNKKFMSTIMSTGTMSDKVSALTLAVQESPVHNIKAFESLISLAGKKSRDQAIAALGAIVDLLGNGMVLPSDRRLRQFAAQPGLIGTLQKHGATGWTSNQKLPREIRKDHLIMFAFEDWLKEAYFRIIQLLEVWIGDEIEYSRSRSLDFVFGLLRDKPEQEANLLRLLVNKLGDRDRKIASRASYLLLQLLNVHPGMKAVVIGAVEQEVLLRPNQNLRTKYYAINTLNQTILSTKEPAIADTLLRIYFDMFLALLRTGSLGDIGAVPTKERSEKKRDKGRQPSSKEQNGHTSKDGENEESAAKLVSSILTGVNRAVPFANADDSTLETHLDTLYKITHSSNFNTSIQALMLIQQLALSKHLAVDRFYRTLYESLLDPRLITSSKQALYLNLLYRAMKNDIDVRRVKAFVKRMLQILNLHQPSFACGILFLIAELESTFPDLKTMLTVAEDHEEDEEEVYKDVVDGETANLDAVATEAQKTSSQPTYDGRKRDPEHSNAHRSCLWELAPFLGHFHPSVAVFAANLLSKQKSLPKPELASHTLIHFLDKFVYRNPKAADAQRGGSIMQPVLAAGSAAHVVTPGKAAVRQESTVNSAAFWNLKPDQVAAEDVFFHEYFSQVGKPAQAAAKAAKKQKAKDDEEAGSDEEVAEDEIWEALVSSRPDVGGEDIDEDDDDVDLDMADYDDSDDNVSLHMSSDEDAEDADGDADGADEGDDGGFEGIFGDSDLSDEDDAEEEEEMEEEQPSKIKRDSRGRLDRKKLKALPMFASADDYAEMLDAEENDLDD